MMVNAFIMSRLDYCNSLCCGLPKREIDKLQGVQYCAARLVSGIRSSDRITPVMKDLHWFNIGARIAFKILLLTFKILNNLAPYYFLFITCQISTGSFTPFIYWFPFTSSSCKYPDFRLPLIFILSVEDL